MNKVKMFFVAAALLLTTAGVFAGKAKFAISALYVYYNNSYTTVASGIGTPTNLTNTGGTGAVQAKITDQAGNAYALWSTNTLGSATPVYTSTNF